SHPLRRVHECRGTRSRYPRISRSSQHPSDPFRLDQIRRRHSRKGRQRATSVRVTTLGYRPNPGIQSTPLYVGEAVFLLAAFWPGLTLAPATAWVGFVLGNGFFVAILPILRAGRLIKTWRRDAWVRGKPIPE